MVVLLHIFCDLVCQDLPPALKVAHPEFFGAESGMFICFLLRDSLELQTDPDEPTASVPSRVKTAIFELSGAYSTHVNTTSSLLAQILSRLSFAFFGVLLAAIKGQNLPTITL